MAEEFATLARPYAEAVFDLAVEANNFDEWSDNLNFLTAVIEDPTIAEVITNPSIDKELLTRILLDICKEHINDQAGINLLKVMIENNRLLAIPQLVFQYEQLKAEHQGIIKVDITSPYPVEPSQQQEIETVLQKRLGKAVDINVTEDKSLLGGWLIRAGDQVIDVSIKGYLHQLATELHR
ncbi:F0F1 ATP synthase subunit delta [Candidatus Parabeggiatoa sp. HSG14]|uniref:F0F1 ATP synthase subunit delta n=1 Tax=Candidatus Parabeggiatoa sp. HSG14 TaxID=3055593 RepID=UPI0025A8F318|nr:F0F1 ATP synthase subunit delta [Thiotrichales bacterium HSG14]